MVKLIKIGKQAKIYNYTHVRIQ